jgi:hypothetical protein
MPIDWEDIKAKLAAVARPLLAKAAVRAILYGAGTVLGAKALGLWSAVSGSASQPSTAQVNAWAEAVASAGCYLLAVGLDYLHHKMDLAEVPPQK